VGRSFAILKDYNIDGNKEMIAIGTMNIIGSFTSCYLTTGTCLLPQSDPGRISRLLAVPNYIERFIRSVFSIRRERQRRLQDGHVKRDHVGDGDDHAAVPDPAVLLHPAGGALGDHPVGVAGPDRLPGRHPPVAGGQGRLLRLRRRLPRRRLWQHRDRPGGHRLHIRAALHVLHRAAEDHGARQHPQLHGLPEDGPVRRGADGARRARAARGRAHLLRQRQLPAR
jgi:hypothetical protein